MKMLILKDFLALRLPTNRPPFIPFSLDCRHSTDQSSETCPTNTKAFWLLLLSPTTEMQMPHQRPPPLHRLLLRLSRPRQPRRLQRSQTANQVRARRGQKILREMRLTKRFKMEDTVPPPDVNVVDNRNSFQL